jgi:hypothetical protein
MIRPFLSINIRIIIRVMPGDRNANGRHKGGRWTCGLLPAKPNGPAGALFVVVRELVEIALVQGRAAIIPIVFELVPVLIIRFEPVRIDVLV